MAASLSGTSTPEAVADHLRGLIHAGTYSEGERIPSQRLLAKDLGVARISVSEAVRLLVDEGYLVVRRGASGGAFVTGLSQPLEAWRRRLRSRTGELDEIIEFRIAVESAAAGLAALRSTKRDLARMRAALRAMRSLQLGRGDARAAFRAADGDFHDAVALAAGNERLQRAIKDARIELFTPYDLLTYSEPVAAVLDDHEGIYEAMRDGDRARAAELMGRHIENTRAQLRSFVNLDPRR